MTKNKGKEFLKVLGISALAIGVFGTAFVGINTLAFAASTGTVESLSPATALVIPAERTIPEGFQEPTLTVAAMEFENEPVTAPSENAMSIEEAAQIGAQYIWEMFGESIDGHFVAMWYIHEPSRTRAYWRGLVAESEGHLAFNNREARENHQPLFNFAIDAITGEWIELYDMNIAKTECEEVTARLRRLRSGDNEVVIPELRPPTSAQLEELTQAAKAHAARHFVGTEVVSVEFFTSGVGSFGLDADGNLYVAYHRFVFEVTDSTGRAANLSVCEVTKDLHWITTAHNDIMPGIDIGPRGIG